MSVGGCQLGRPTPASASYVEPIPAVDAKELGRLIAHTVGDVWPGARTTILLVPPADSIANNDVTAALTAGLLENGFAIVSSETVGSASPHRLQYWVTPWDGHALVRLLLDASPRACLYGEDSKGHLVAITPLTVGN